MNKFLFVFYVGLYAFVAGALVTIDVVSIKAGWPWLSQLVKPMGIVFLCVNIPLAFFAVLKIGHVVFLHSYQHHQSVMRSIRAADLASLPHSTTVQQKISVKDETLSQQSQPIGTLTQHVPSSQNVPMSQGVKSDNAIVAAYLVDYPFASIRDVEKGTGVSKSNVGRTYAWKNRSR